MDIAEYGLVGNTDCTIGPPFDDQNMSEVDMRYFAYLMPPLYPIPCLRPSFLLYLIRFSLVDQIYFC
jgi:hypothetical protein